jgi:NAD(P)-dependent dehydrogenase (short-subunit alcohol dehydrogenase family)
MHHSLNLTDRVAIVAGIGPGMGRDIALALAGAGADIVLAARSEQHMAAVQQEIDGLGRQALAVVTDIASDRDCSNLAARALGRFGRIDILVNNAFAIGDMQPFERTDIEHSWTQVLNINLLGFMRLSQAVIPAMKQQGGGAIVMINSVSMVQFKKTSPSVISYASSKAGLLSAAMYMAGELGQYNIRVNTVRPGYIDGPALQGYFTMKGEEWGISPEAAQQRVIDEELALNFVPHSADIAEAVLFLASDMARAITGATLDVNAGERIAMQ